MRLIYCTLVLLLGVVGLHGLHGQPTSSGSLAGRIIDEASGADLAGVAVILRPVQRPAGAAGDGSMLASTGAEGRFRLDAVPAGAYAVRLFKGGYQLVELERIEIEPGKVASLNYPLRSTTVAVATAGNEEEADSSVFELAAFQVTAEELSKKERVFFDLRRSVSQSVDFLTVEDLSKFAVSDMADAIKRIPGVNVQDGKFAVIRGLDERYTSTLLNNLAIPSPDPDRQSPQLDLFPADVVGSLSVTKSFAPLLPGNSAGGSINILTTAAPEQRELTLAFGTGFNDNARDLFWKPERGSAIGTRSGKNQKEYDYGISAGAPFTLVRRKAHVMLDVSREIDFETEIGTVHHWAPLESRVKLIFPPFPARQELLYGDLALGVMTSDEGLWDKVDSTREERLSAFAAFGIDLDPAGDHKLGAVAFSTENSDETLSYKYNGRFEGVDYEDVTTEEFQQQVARTGRGTNFMYALITREIDPWLRGNQFTDFFSSASFFRDREFRVGQLYGDHRWNHDNELSVKWGANYAETSQDEESQRFSYYYQPAGSLPDYPEYEDTYFVPEGQTFSGIFFYSRNAIEESLFSGRGDATYKIGMGRGHEVELDAGFYYEDAQRSVESAFADRFSTQGSILSGDNPADLEQRVYSASGAFRPIDAASETSRVVEAAGLGAKVTISDRFEFLAGWRFEDVLLTTVNDPFADAAPDQNGVSIIYPSKFLMFEVVDDAVYDGWGGAFETYETGNPGLLNLDVPRDANGRVNLTDAQLRSLLNSRLDESFTLPSFGFIYRPFEGMRLILNHSKTVARPSFREIAYYVSTEPGSEDLVVGNPQLGTSAVSSQDLRLEYVSPGSVDLAAVSVFRKKIEDPIEKITLFDRQWNKNFQTFFNNENEADLEGVEFEARKNLGFVGQKFFEHLTLGFNYTRIDATVARPAAEVARSQYFFLIPNPPPGLTPAGSPLRTSMPAERPLFNQPKWIANADITFEQEEWGTTVTLSAFAISDVLASAGSSTVSLGGRALDVVPDRYIGAHLQWDLVLQQKWGAWSFKLSVKNLTDSRRTSLYDPSLFGTAIEEKQFRVGRDYSLSAAYSF